MKIAKGVYGRLSTTFKKRWTRYKKGNKQRTKQTGSGAPGTSQASQGVMLGAAPLGATAGSPCTSESAPQSQDQAEIADKDGEVGMPVEPNTIASCMYYICDSHMLQDFEGLVTMSRKERDKLLCSADSTPESGVVKLGSEKRYDFGTMTGVSGAERVGVDYVVCVQDL